MGNKPNKIKNLSLANALIDNNSLIESYINSFPENTRIKLNEIRTFIKEIIPTSKEIISYRMPCFIVNGPIVYYAGYKNHIGLYPLPDSIQIFSKEISIYKHSKGAVQFRLDEPLPRELIKKIVEYRLEQDKKKKI